ncbi:hypothetical protein [Caldimonas tepidiphila]|uniref:hypothetical protein n=1 Tax=Caldimonas tepidiphila TaxID=2315841 RepID=UPI000E5AA741|nr:hypothetical protein [Caldimonas tepidiphila]
MPASPAQPDPPRRFGAAVWHATAPLLLWALHFFALYVVVAAGCMRGWSDARWAGLPAVSLSLLVFSAAVLALMIAMLARSVRDSRHKPQGDPVIPALRLGGGVLALVGVVWETAPLLMVPPCGL